MGDRIDADLIWARWDDILPLMTSLRTRTVTASLMFKRLSATTRQSGLAQALRQMGRIEHTLFTLDWINDENLRKTTTVELNKGESRNSLVRAVNLYRLGRFRDRSQENLSIRTSALNLVVTAIIHWNSIYTDRVVDALHAGGQNVSDHLLGSLSPLTWEHVNLRRLHMAGQACARRFRLPKPAVLRLIRLPCICAPLDNRLIRTQPDTNCSKLDRCEEIAAAFVVSSCDGPEVFEFSDLCRAV